MSFDAIVIGGGHNGLAAAGLLAKEGRQVLVLERRDVLGGAAAGEEFHPGFRTQGLHLDTCGVRADLASELDLEAHGLRFRDAEAPVVVPGKNGGLTLHRDPARLKGLSEADGKACGELRAFLDRIGGILRYILDNAPPPVDDSGTRGLLALLSTGLRLRALGRTDMQEVLRVAPMCVGDFLKERFENELLRAALAGPSVEGTFMGPWSAGTTATFLLRDAVSARSVRGGPAGLMRAMEAAVKAKGVEIRTGAEVSRIKISDGRTVGVVLAGGEEIGAPVILSSADPKRTLLGLIPPTDLPLKLEEQARCLRARGTTAKVNLALSGPLEFSGGETVERARIAESLDGVERAFDCAKYRRFSDKPYLDVKVSTVDEPGLAPEGKHVVEILAHFAPYDLEGGWTDKAREAFGDNVVAVLAEHAPQLKGSIVAREVLTPKDLEDRYGLTNGHIYHGEPFLDQLYSLRPSVDCAQYATPIKGLFLGGSGSHPGGGVTGRPGLLAAEAVLAAG